MTGIIITPILTQKLFNLVGKQVVKEPDSGFNPVLSVSINER